MFTLLLMFHGYRFYALGFQFMGFYFVDCHLFSPLSLKEMFPSILYYVIAN
jgi:hypothetical protein